VIAPVDDVAATEALAGDTAYPHPPACVIITVWPAIVRTPERGTVAVFCATAYCTEPLPVPLAGAVTVIQGEELAAVQAQPAAAVTATLPVEAAAPTDAVVGLMV